MKQIILLSPARIPALSRLLIGMALFCFTGCGAMVGPALQTTAGTPVTVRVASTTVSTGSTDAFTATQGGVPVSGGVWSVVGGGPNGTIDKNGVYQAPIILPQSNPVTVQYLVDGASYTSAVTIVNSITSSTITVESPQADVTLNGFDQFTVTQSGTPISGGVWSVVGGSSNGTIDQTGLYHAPAIANISGTATVEYILSGESATSTVQLVAPGPTGITVTPEQTTVQTNGQVQFAAMEGGSPALGGSWVVLGGTANGSITSDGLYSAPAQAPNPALVEVGYISNQTLYSAGITVLNPIPTIQQISPNVLTSVSTPIVVTGTGFTSQSVIAVNGASLPTVYQDSSHLSAQIVLSNPSSSVLQITVITAGSSSTTSSAVPLPANFPTFNVTPSILRGGPVTLSITGTNFDPSDIVLLSGNALTTTFHSATSITATGYLPPWTSGSVLVEIGKGDGLQPIAAVSLPIAPTAASFDAAARFATQAALGPRPDVVLAIQQMGFDAWLTNQMQESPVQYDPTQSGLTQFIHAATTGNALLRQRLSLALESFIVPQDQDFDPSVTVLDATLQADATGNFRQILTDITQSPNFGWFLNLANNSAATSPLVQPNQNYARELMQLFTLGPFLLNDDGSVQTDGKGNPLPTYTQATVVDLTRALTGWTYQRNNVDPSYYAYAVDWLQPMLPDESLHDEGSKLLFGTVAIPPNQNAETDMTEALDAIFNHPNLPPFISHLLIQRLVTSNPSPAYIERISKVFENDGTGVRGNMAAVVRAILLDPEARKGDTVPSPNDGFLKEPMLWELSTVSALNILPSDDEPDYIAGELGEHIWGAPTVFGSFSPSYTIPGTSITSPEFELLNNIYANQKSNILWNIVTRQQGGFTNDYTKSSWLFQNFTTVPGMIDALDHLMYHGQMSQQERDAITSYCATLNLYDIQYQLQSAVFLALDAESNDVSQ